MINQENNKRRFFFLDLNRNGIKNQRDLLLLVPWPFKEMMRTFFFQAVMVREVNLLSAYAK